MPLGIIVARAGWVIGNKGDMPWGNLPRDLQNFRGLTMDKTLAGGSKTIDSIRRAVGRNTAMLPGRKIVVLSKNPSIGKEFPDCAVASSVDDILALSKKEDVLIIGGGIVYQQFIELPEVTTMYITNIRAEFEGDAFFPKYSTDDWDLELESVREYPPDQKNKYPLSFNTFHRRK